MSRDALGNRDYKEPEDEEARKLRLEHEAIRDALDPLLVLLYGELIYWWEDMDAYMAQSRAKNFMVNAVLKEKRRQHESDERVKHRSRG